MNNFSITSPKGREMFSFLPGYYDSSRVMQADMNSKGEELDHLSRALDEILDQFFVRTATWGLERWEAELGISTDLTKPIEERRAVVESKLRGTGKFSGQLVRNVMDSFIADGEVVFTPGEYKFRISFGERIPSRLGDFKSVIEEIKPAHLVFYMDWRARLEFHHTIRIAPVLKFRTRVNFFGGRPWYLDGIEFLDGNHSLSGWTGNRERFKNRTQIAVRHRNKPIQEAVLKIRSNYWQLDGAVALDGSRQLSSMESINLI
ncbi:YmfQ family protein [Paenibacillus fonticola]|uniref:YmfQ family protein n=1 Tax=Paenibacillus fonticola TaxID=379896 RepID=UPI000369BE3B|nr:YmfQ family protein [Paenibacillus fonticola]